MIERGILVGSRSCRICGSAVTERIEGISIHIRVRVPLMDHPVDGCAIPQRCSVISVGRGKSSVSAASVTTRKGWGVEESMSWTQAVYEHCPLGHMLGTVGVEGLAARHLTPVQV